jgi:putative ABC transport system permease protein
VFLLTLRDLQFRALRFAIAIVGVSLVFAMVLLMAGLSARFRDEPRITTEALGGDAWVVREGVSGPFTSSAQFEADTVDELRSSGVERADPLIITRLSVEVDGARIDFQLIGHEPDGLGAPALSAGEGVSVDGEFVAGEELGLDVGEEVEIGGQSFVVVGLTSGLTIGGGTAMGFMTVKDVQTLVFGDQDVVTAVLIEGDVPESLPEGVQALTPDEVVADTFRQMEKPVSAIDVVQILLWVVAATIIGAVVYLSALERRRDFAVLKAVGASSKGLLLGLATQSVLVALIAAVVAGGLSQALVPLFPLPVTVPLRAYVMLPILALVAGAVASLGGLRKAVNVDPALAFAGPGG